MSAAMRSDSPGAGGVDLPVTRFSNFVDYYLIKLGKAVSWLWIVIVVVIVITIIVRYGATKLGIQTDSYWGSRLLSSVFWEELSWYIYGYAWLLALGYALVTDVHVRVDILHERISRKAQVWVEVFGLLFFFIPVFVAILSHGLDFGMEAFRDGEGSQQVGLDFRWFIKFSIPFASFCLILAGVSKLTRCIRWLKDENGKATMPLLIVVQALGIAYLGLMIYFMYSWSAENDQLMTVFKIFGFSAGE